MITMTIRELGTVVTGHTPPTSKREYYGDSYPFLKPTDMVIGSKYAYVTEEGYSEIAANKFRNSLIPKGSTCVVCIGTLGEKMAMAHCDLFTNQSINSIIPDKRYDPNYVYYLLKYNLHRVKALNKGTASGREFVSKSTFLDLEIKVVDKIEKQQKIGAILSAYDDLIENNQKQIKLIEEAAQRMYKEWFIDLRFPGHETTPIHDGIPEGWEKVTVESVSTILRRGISPTYDQNGDTTVINQKCIRKTIVDLNEARKQNKAYPPELNLHDGDTVICSTGDGTLGRVGQIFGVYENTTFDSHVTLVRAAKSIGKQFLFWSIKSRQAFLQGMGRGSTNQLELNRSVIQSLPILLPNRSIMDKFERVAQEMHEKISVANAQIIDLETARDRLLPKLMSGEIEV